MDGSRSWDAGRTPEEHPVPGLNMRRWLAVESRGEYMDGRGLQICTGS